LDRRGELLIKRFNPLLNQLQQPLAISHIEICLSDDQAVLLVRHPKPLPEHDLQALQSLMGELDFQLYLQPGDADSLHSAAGQPVPLSYHLVPRLEPPSDPRLTQTDPPPLSLRFQPSDFIQINAGINQQMINLALMLLQPNRNDRILDLFCGLGNFTLPLARYAGEVVGVEAVEAMVQRGRDNAALNQLENISFIAADLAQPINDQPRFKQLLKAGFNKVLLDPPRAGAFEVLAPLAKLAPEQILYISCDPATLARDAAELTRLGYQLQRWTVINMFPHTSHVESIALFINNRG
jgi:23S rRNA (uracil1939-C5)-methyltransferase